VLHSAVIPCAVLSSPVGIWLAANWVAVVGWILAAGGWVSAIVAVIKLWNARKPRLHFNMWAVIRSSEVHPRETLLYRFRNSGNAPVHITNIQGDNGFTLIEGPRDYFDPVTIHVDPEPFEGEVPAPYAGFMKKHPTRIYAVDSTGKHWRLPKKDLTAIYKVFEQFRSRKEYEQTRGSCTCCED
jgi:hypothetical protein